MIRSIQLSFILAITFPAASAVSQTAETAPGAEADAATPAAPDRLNDDLARLESIARALGGMERGALRPEPQDHARATHAPALEKADGRIDWTLPAPAIACRVRGFNPWPGAFTTWAGSRLGVWRARPGASRAATAGAILGRDGEALLVGCGSFTTLALTEVQPEGRRRMTGAAFALGARPGPDARFE